MRNKYGNVRTEVDGVVFDSAQESRRYAELVLLERMGEITNLRLQPRYTLQPAFVREGKKIRKIEFVGDYEYLEVDTGKRVCEDVKAWDSKRGVFITTPLFDLKLKLALFIHRDIDFRVV